MAVPIENEPTNFSEMFSNFSDIFAKSSESLKKFTTSLNVATDSLTKLGLLGSSGGTFKQLFATYFGAKAGTSGIKSDAKSIADSLKSAMSASNTKALPAPSDKIGTKTTSELRSIKDNADILDVEFKKVSESASNLSTSLGGITEQLKSTLGKTVGVPSAGSFGVNGAGSFPIMKTPTGQLYPGESFGIPGQKFSIPGQKFSIPGTGRFYIPSGEKVEGSNILEKLKGFGKSLFPSSVGNLSGAFGGKLDSILGSFSKLLGPLAMFKDAIKGLTIAIGALIALSERYSRKLESTIKSGDTLRGGGLGGLSSRQILNIRSIAGSAKLLWENLSAGIGRFLSGIAPHLVNFINILSGFVEGFANYGEILGRAFGGLLSIISAVIAALKIFAGGLQMVIGSLLTAVTGILHAVAKLVDAVTGSDFSAYTGNFLDAATGFTKSGYDLANEGWSDLANTGNSFTKTKDLGNILGIGSKKGASFTGISDVYQQIQSSIGTSEEEKYRKDSIMLLQKQTEYLEKIEKKQAPRRFVKGPGIVD